LRLYQLLQYLTGAKNKPAQSVGLHTNSSTISLFCRRFFSKTYYKALIFSSTITTIGVEQCKKPFKP
jgi:hypothetical protein